MYYVLNNLLICVCTNVKILTLVQAQLINKCAAVFLINVCVKMDRCKNFNHIKALMTGP